MHRKPKSFGEEIKAIVAILQYLLSAPFVVRRVHWMLVPISGYTTLRQYRKANTFRGQSKLSLSNSMDRVPAF